MAADQRWRWWVAALGALALGDCRSANECNPGTSRPCTRALDGGVSQAGYQSCESTGEWSACVSVGGCRAGGAALPIYARCAASDECGPAGCAFCTNFQGVSNPHGFSVCEVYCQADADCAPTTASAGVTARCILGQCALLCRAGSTCPRDSQCLGWEGAASASAFPGYAGLCE
jgi:hypothetical protein